MNFQQRYLFLCPIAIVTFVVLVKVRSPGVPNVEGWYNNTSRNITDYISEKLKPHIMPENFGFQKDLLLVIIISKPSNFEARRAIRETWGQKRANVSFYFLLGEVINHPELQSEIQIESIHYEDIIQERFVDHYNNLTLKSVNMLKLFSTHCANACKYLMKVDDDVFLNIDLVVSMLSQRSISTDLLVGKVRKDTSPFRGTRSKWFVPYEWYPEEKYPDYLCGLTYLMSADVVRKLYECALETPIFYIEDVYVTGICAKKMKLVPQHDQFFTCDYIYSDICSNKDMYSLHYHTPNDIRNSHKILKNKECGGKIGWRIRRAFDVLLGLPLSILVKIW